MPGGNRRASGPVANNCSGCLPGPGCARSGPVNKQLFGLAHRTRDSAGQHELLPGKIRGNTPVCPAASTPNPNNCSRSPIPKTPIFKRRGCSSKFELHTQREMTPIPNNCAQSRKSSSCNPESRWYNNPNNLSVYPEPRCWQ